MLFAALAAAAVVAGPVIALGLLGRRRRDAAPTASDVVAGLHPDDIVELSRRHIAVLAEHRCPPGVDIELSALWAREVPVSRIAVDGEQTAVVFTDGTQVRLTAPPSAAVDAIARMRAPRITGLSAGDGRVGITFADRRRSTHLVVAAAEVI